MQEFGELNDANNDSILSRKSQHGLSEFGDFQNNPIDSSMVSEKEIGEGEGEGEGEKKKEEEGSALDDF